VVAAIAVVMVVNSVTAFLIVRLFGHSIATALALGASVAQIGEFSFILAGIGVGLKLLPEAGRDFILAGAILSIMVNPALFAATEWLQRKHRAPAEEPGTPLPAAKLAPLVPTQLKGHAVLVGYGRVGRIVGEALRARAQPFIVIEASHDVATKLRDTGTEALSGNGADPALIYAANVAGARLIFVAIPNAFEAGQIVEQARRANAGLKIIARAHFDAEVEHLRSLGADSIIMGEREIADAMVADAFGQPPAKAT
jgi:CPA2 family monovalent cation:H+ antiporter-2